MPRPLGWSPPGPGFSIYIIYLSDNLAFAWPTSPTDPATVCATAPPPPKCLCQGHLCIMLMSPSQEVGLSSLLPEPTNPSLCHLYLHFLPVKQDLSLVWGNCFFPPCYFWLFLKIESFSTKVFFLMWPATNLLRGSNTDQLHSA